jgi:hypothetical protein
MSKEILKCEVCKKIDKNYHFILKCDCCEISTVVCVKCFANMIGDNPTCNSCIRIEKINDIID